VTAAAYVGLVGGFWAILRVMHGLGDYVFQAPAHALGKDGPGWAGRGACLAHVGTQVALAAAALGVLGVLAPGPALYSVPRLVAALVVIGATHYFADRREPLRRLMSWIRRGRDPEWLANGGLAFADQEWHRWWLLVASVILAGGVPVWVAG
jgi:hypothetical protein